MPTTRYYEGIAETVRRITSNYGSITIPTAYLKVLSAEAAIILQKIVILCERAPHPKDPCQQEGWRLCTRNYLEVGLSMNRHTQHRLLKKLRDLGIIELQMLNYPSRRYLRINQGKFGEFIVNAIEVEKQSSTFEESNNLDDQSANNLDSQSSNNLDGNKDIKENKTLKEERHSPSARTPPAGQPSFNGEDQYLLNAIRLWEALNAKKLIPTPNRQVAKRQAEWSTWLRKAKNEYGGIRYRAAFDWYLDHIGVAMVPEARCGRTFFEKFVRIEAAIKRENRDRDNNVGGHRLHTLSDVLPF